MTVDEAKKEIDTMDSLCEMFCNYCTANDWYCPSECNELLKARELGFDRLVNCYARHDGDLVKVMRYIKETKLVQKKGGY